MWAEMRNVNVIAVFAFLVCCTLNSGCWITRTWKDYLPIAGVALKDDVKTYSGYFVMRRTGSHVLALRIKRKENLASIPVELRLHGKVQIFHGRKCDEITFDEAIGAVTLPPTPFDVILTGFNGDAAENSDCDYGQFHVTVDGDIADFLRREPESYLIVRFTDAE